MMTADPEYYQNLRKELTNHGRWFAVGLIGFGVCISLALEAGAIAGWSWLLGSLVFLLFALWARMDQQHTSLLIQIYLASAK